MLPEEKVGNYLSDQELLDKSLSYSTLYAYSEQFITSWRRCSLTADFWSKYYEKTFENKNVSKRDFQNIVSFIMNELIENVGKYCDVPSGAMQIKVFFKNDQVNLKVSNQLKKKTAEKFFETVKGLFIVDLDELYFQRLEENLETGEGSGMGYLTMIQDYGVELGFRFLKKDQERYQVEVLAELNF